MLHTIQPVFVALKRILAGILWRVDPSQSCWYCICVFCNRHKAARQEVSDPQSGRTVPLFNPRRQIWEDHFAWSADFTEIFGLTATGRATIAALRMNRPQLIRARRIWVKLDEHPPRMAG
jgi:hypothetical protein